VTKFLFWKYSVATMFLMAIVGLLGKALGVWSINGTITCLIISFGFALNCIFQGLKLVFSDDRNGWFSTYAGSIGIGALVPLLMNFL